MNVILSIETVLFCFMAILIMPTVLKFWKKLNKSKKQIALAWSAMIVGQHQLFTHDKMVEGVTSLTSAAYYQLGWMLVAGFIALPVILSSQIRTSVWRYPVIAFAIYVFIAFVSAVLSPSPAMTVYRSLQILVDLGLILVAYTELKRSGTPELLVTISIFWLSILLFTIIAGAFVAPELAFIENKGAIGVSLTGVVPRIHPNELGLMAAIGFVVAMIRGVGGGEKGKLRLFWLLMVLISGTILFLAQARTSLAGALIALVLIGFLIKKMRWLAYCIMLLGVGISLYYFFSGSKLGVEDDIETYARRGVSDEQIKTMSGRTELWATGFQMFKDSPLLGHGFQTGVRNRGVEYGLYKGTNMHSAHMQVLVDTGALGYIAWITFVGGMTIITVKNYRESKNRGVRERLIAAENLLIIFVILFRSILGHVIVSHQLNLVIFLSIYVFSIIKHEDKGQALKKPKNNDNNQVKTSDSIIRKKEKLSYPETNK